MLAQVGLKHDTLLPQSPECLDFVIGFVCFYTVTCRSSLQILD
jgi:hypothetical protein